MTTLTTTDLTALARDAGPRADQRAAGMARELIGSEVLQIAGEIRALVRAGREICNLTVGDFDPKQFRIPPELMRGIVAALDRGETNYPPSDGVLELRHAVVRFYERTLGLKYPVESVLIAGGARPLLYGTFRTLLDPEDRVVYPVPSWNNNHYAHLAGAIGVPVRCRREDAFLPTRAALVPTLATARLLCLNSPLNPTGTAFEVEELRGICAAVLEENKRRDQRGERPLYLLYDQVYWLVCMRGMEHVTPPGLVPEIARYTIFVDGISKAFAATGVRVGWGVGPVDVIERMSAVLGHVGAWAPRAEQVATAALLDDAGAIQRFLDGFRRGVEARLRRLHDGLGAMKRAGLPVDVLPPMGAIYLAARFHPFGAHTSEGRQLATSEDVRRYLLEAAGFAIVPFRAFGADEDEGWFRLSIGAVGEEDIAAALPRVERALRSLRH
jgi:aspartate aminotransferase